MSWKNLVVRSSKDNAERYSEVMSEAGALSVSIEDADRGRPEESPLFAEPGMPENDYWQHCSVAGLFEQDTEFDALLASLNDVAPERALQWKLETLEDADWVRLTQAQFEPIQISARMWIVPSWHEAPPNADIVLQLDPGLAFGTGSHPTTRLCLRWLDENIQGGERILDYGCGSGILAIAALKLGAGQASGTDIDTNAVIASRANAQMNAVRALFAAPEAIRDVRADIVVANILAKPLQVLAPLLANHCRPGGMLVLSGILREQADAVIETYAGIATLQIWRAEDGWVCLAGMRQADKAAA